MMGKTEDIMEKMRSQVESGKAPSKAELMALVSSVMGPVMSEMASNAKFQKDVTFTFKGMGARLKSIEAKLDALLGQK